jgi:hypothetical protein
MSAKNKPDVSAYPVLRIDELQLFDSEFLRKSVNDVRELIESLRSSGSDHKSMIVYLLKQVDEVNAELTRRIARERIERLLNGDIFSETTYSAVVSSESYSAPAAAEVKDDPPTRIPVNYIPLPSELRALELAKKSGDSLQMNHSDPQRHSISTSSLTVDDGSADLGQFRSSKSVSDISKSSGERSTSAALFAPSRKSVEALNSSFGVAFVVGATEKKKRFYMKPKAVIDPEAEKERNRNERLDY